MRKIVAAIDLGTSKITCAVGEMTVNGIKIIGFHSLPSKGILRAEVINIQQVVNIAAPLVQEVEKSIGLKLKSLFLGLSGQNIRCIIQTHHLIRKAPDDLITEDEISGMTNQMYNINVNSGEKILHVIPQAFNIDDFLVITEPAGMIGKEIGGTFNVIIGKESMVANLQNFANRCGGLKLLGVSLNSLASARAVANNDYREMGVAIVDIGAGSTDITIIEQNMVRYTAVVPFGGNAITNDIKMEFNIASRQAEDLKRVHGSAYSQYTQANKAVAIPGMSATDLKEISIRNLARVIEARVQEIFEAVDYHLVQSGYKEMLNAGILITGGGSKLMHICQCAKLVTGLEAYTAAPQNSVTEDSVGDITSPESSTVIGLILNGFDKMAYSGESFDTTSPLAEQNLFSQEEEREKEEIKEKELSEKETLKEEAALQEKNQESAKKNKEGAKGKGNIFSRAWKAFTSDNIINNDA